MNERTNREVFMGKKRGYSTMTSFTRALAISEQFSEDDDPESESVLGIVPHQVSKS